MARLWVFKVVLCMACAALPAQSAFTTSPRLRHAASINDPKSPSFASPQFGDYMVLQQAPARAAVYGTAPAGSHLKVLFNGKTIPTATSANGAWKALLDPTEAGGDYEVAVECESGCEGRASVSHVTFGDVWYCSGQSNMALPLAFTMERNKTLDAIAKGGYTNIRITGMKGNMNVDQPWATLQSAVDAGTILKFSSTCLYYGQSLTDTLGAAAPPLGLIHTAYGGSRIEQWLTNDTISTCHDATTDQSDGQWWKACVLSYKDMTIKGWVWYQGENNMHSSFGNADQNRGYSCLMVTLLSAWRKVWSTTPGTTDPTAPFGLVTLAPSGTEGGNDIGTMRHAQTGSFGTLPSPAMPNTFLAQGFDLDDPFTNITCYSKGCCNDQAPPECWSCGAYCQSTAGTNFYMGPIHPRDKLIVGQRLAQSCSVAVYGKGGPVSGPTIKGCRRDGNNIVVTFDKDAMGGDKLVVQPYLREFGASKMQVLVNSTAFCMQTTGRGPSEECIDDGQGHAMGRGDFSSGKQWVAVDITAGAQPNELVLDLTKTGGVAHAIRYAWTGDCCTERPPTGDPCPVASCPLMGQPSNLPANPFMAKVTNTGKCECIAPQVCDA